MIRYNPNRTNAYLATFRPGTYVSACGDYRAVRVGRGMWQVYRVTVVRMVPNERHPEGERMPDLLSEVFCYSTFTIAARELPAARAKGTEHAVRWMCGGRRDGDDRCGRAAISATVDHEGPCDWVD